MFISTSPGFELTRVIDNKKSWLANTTPQNRPFSITNVPSTNSIRQTNYDVNDERLVINTKEIDLDIDIASAIETDVWCYVYENPCLLTATTVSDTDCGCNLLECYEDVFKIIPYAEAVDSGIIPAPIDPEDLVGKARAVRDAWLKAWNQLMLATGPYLDIKNGIYYPNPSEDTMGTYLATQAAWRKALHQFNLASGGGHIEGLTIDVELGVGNSYTMDNYSVYEKLAPQMFNTKCGRIFKLISEEGYMYFVETPTKELKVYISNTDFAPRNTTWIDITSLVQEDYASNWDYQGTPEKASYYCKFINGGNYNTWVQMMNFHYQTNGNTSHDEWVNPVEDTFFIDWNDQKGKCMTEMFKQVVPEQFSMHYPITSLNFWTNYGDGGLNPLGESPACNVEVYLRNSGTTECVGVDWTWPNVAGDIDTLYRTHRNANLKLLNETKLSEKQVISLINIIDPATNMLPDETSGIIPLKVTTTIRKGSRDGDIVYKEEYVINDPSATCPIFLPSSTYGMSILILYVGVADPNSFYMNPNGDDYLGIYGCSSYGTVLSGSTSELPLAGASANGIDRNWRFDVDYYIHFDVVDNNTNYVYEVTNNDYNLKDRVLPIVCPTSASTQTLDINSALNSINTHKTKMLSNIQEDLDYALGACIICECDANCEEDLNTYVTRIDFMDDLAAIPTAEEIISVGSGSRCGCDYSSYSTVQQSYDDFGNTILPNINAIGNDIYDFNQSLSAYTANKNIGFCDDVLTQPDITLISGHTFPNNYFYKGNPYKIKGYTPCQASLLDNWTTNNVAFKLSAYTNDITYIKAVPTFGDLPISGSAGNVIVVGTPSSYTGYAWDPTTNNWSTSFYNDMSDIFIEIETKRTAFNLVKEEVIRAMKPFTWANNYLPLHSIRLWALPEAPYVSGEQILNSGGKYSPCPYKITTEACNLLPYCGTYKHVDNDLC